MPEPSCTPQLERRREWGWGGGGVGREGEYGGKGEGDAKQWLLGRRGDLRGSIWGFLKVNWKRKN